MEAVATKSPADALEIEMNTLTNVISKDIKTLTSLADTTKKKGSILDQEAIGSIIAVRRNIIAEAQAVKVTEEAIVNQ